MKLYNSNGNSKLESFESNNNSWNGGLYGNGTTKVPAYQQQQSQPQQQLDQINFLVRKECCNEIDQAVKELGISAGKSLSPLFFPPLFFACFRIEHSFIHSFTHSFATPVCPAMGIGKILSSFLDAYQSGSTAFSSSFSHKQPTFFLVSILVHRIFLLSLHCELWWSQNFLPFLFYLLLVLSLCLSYLLTILNKSNFSNFLRQFACSNLFAYSFSRFASFLSSTDLHLQPFASLWSVCVFNFVFIFY